jgi:hypothetical protein
MVDGHHPKYLRGHSIRLETRYPVNFRPFREIFSTGLGALALILHSNLVVSLKGVE